MLNFNQTLEKGQYLTDLDLKFKPNQINLMTSPTGTGKTTFTMEALSDQYSVVFMVVPSVLKVIELEHHTSAKKIVDGVKLPAYKFFYDSKVPTVGEFSKFKGVIVGTYDKFHKVDELLNEQQRSQTLLVVDEFHKLYSAGSFRDEALMPIICNLKERRYPNALLVTATFTPDRWLSLEIPFNSHYCITTNDPMKRTVKVMQLDNSHKLAYVNAIIDRLDNIKAKRAARQASDDTVLIAKKKIIVRLNNRKKCEQMAAYIETVHKVKCMVVHSKNKKDALVSTLFNTQKIPADIDIVFTTSILDEAVNINNAKLEMDSVFIIGNGAHPEEIVQFMGRLRHASVPCFIVLNKEIGDKRPTDMVSMHESVQNKIREFTQRIAQIGELTSNLVDDFVLKIFDTDDDDESNIFDKVKRLNATFEDLCGVKLFAVYKYKVHRNYASISANNYRMDCSYCYKNFYYLRWRIKQLLPTCKVFSEIYEDVEEPEGLSEFLKNQNEISDQQFDDSIEDGVELFIKGPCPHALSQFNQEYDDRPPAIIAHSMVFSELVQSDEDYLLDVAKAANASHPKACEEVLSQVVALGRHISNLHDIKHIVQNRQTHKVLVAANGYSNNIMVQHLVQKYYRYKPERHMDGTYKLSAKLAQKHLLSSVKLMTKRSNIPMNSIIKAKLLKGLTYDHKTNEIKCAASKALNFLAKYFEVEDVNKNKSSQRYLRFKNIAIGGYEYNCIADIQDGFINVDPVITIKGVKYYSYDCRKVIHHKKVVNFNDSETGEYPDDKPAAASSRQDIVFHDDVEPVKKSKKAS